jgi:hypothetical protein
MKKINWATVAKAVLKGLVTFLTALGLSSCIKGL